MNTKKSYKTKKSRRKENNQLWVLLLLAAGGLILIVAGIILFGGGDQADKTATISLEVSGAPSLKVDQEVIDFGDVKVNEVVEATFRLANVGDQPLHFTQAPYVELAAGC